jgi:hypothetical protein
MGDQVWVETVSERILAAVRVRLAVSEIALGFRGPLDRVWAFLRTQDGLRTDGHNVFIYRTHPDAIDDGKLIVDFGVQVTRAFPDVGDIICTATPGGRAAIALHVGLYRELGRTHDTVQRWCAANGHQLAGVDWEIYGDWTEDPTKSETHVYYLLRS